MCPFRFQHPRYIEYASLEQKYHTYPWILDFLQIISRSWDPHIIKCLENGSREYYIELIIMK